LEERFSVVLTELLSAVVDTWRLGMVTFATKQIWQATLLAGDNKRGFEMLLTKQIVETQATQQLQIQ
jgi:hypothetical protein